MKKSHPTLQVVILKRCGTKFCCVICDKDDNVIFTTSSVKKMTNNELSSVKDENTIFDVSSFLTDVNIVLGLSSLTQITQQLLSCYLC